MRKKGILKQAVALTLALGISLSGSLVAYADQVYIQIIPSTTFQTIKESRTFMDDAMDTPYQRDDMAELYDANTTFTFDRAKTIGVDFIYRIEYGYIEGDKFVITNTNHDIDMDGVYPIFDTALVQKDQQAEITGRVYVAVINGSNNRNYNECWIPFLFRLSATPSQQTEGWVQDSTGWWYRNADGSYPTNAWKEINSKQYYFGAGGYMLHDTTTPDGYTVGSDGVWIQPATVN